MLLINCEPPLETRDNDCYLTQLSQGLYQISRGEKRIWKLMRIIQKEWTTTEVLSALACLLIITALLLTLFQLIDFC